MSEEKQNKEQNARSEKPVVVYIMILFIAAFLLMALSFLMHQRSNTEALGQLQNSMTAMQEVQATQEKNIELQDELDKTTAAYDGQLAALVDDVEQKQLALDAMTNLYLLQQAYSAGEYESCMEVIRFMEENQQVDALLIEGAAEGSASDGICFPSFWNSPTDRFQQLKEATEARLGQTEPAPAE